MKRERQARDERGVWCRGLLARAKVSKREAQETENCLTQQLTTKIIKIMFQSAAEP